MTKLTDGDFIQATRYLQATLVTIESKYKKITEAGIKAKESVNKLAPYLRRLGSD